MIVVMYKVIEMVVFFCEDDCVIWIVDGVCVKVIVK